MKILICTPTFKPVIGGIETVGALLAERFGVDGHEVIVATLAANGTRGDELDYPVARAPGLPLLRRMGAWADVVLHNQISLRLAAPLATLRTPSVVMHHAWLPRHGPGRWAGAAKRALAAQSVNLAVSQALADSLPMPCEVVPNPYANDVFLPMPAITRRRDLVFVGRWVSDKGVELLLQALVRLRARGALPTLTLIGEGPEEAALRARVAEWGLDAQVSFAGPRRGRVLAALLNAHRVVVVPSVWDEPFGLAAIEGMACGCVPVVSRSGGLPQAVGAAGVLFDKGDAGALADAIGSVLSDQALRQRLRAAAAAQLMPHRAGPAARRVLSVLQAAAQSRVPARLAAQA